MHMTKSTITHFNSGAISTNIGWSGARLCLPNPRDPRQVWWHPYSCPPYMYWKPLYSSSALRDRCIDLEDTNNGVISPCSSMSRLKGWTSCKFAVSRTAPNQQYLLQIQSSWATYLLSFINERISHNIVSFIKPLCGLAWTRISYECIQINGTAHPCNRGLAVGSLGLGHLRPNSAEIILNSII